MFMKKTGKRISSSTLSTILDTLLRPIAIAIKQYNYKKVSQTERKKKHYCYKKACNSFSDSVLFIPELMYQFFPAFRSAEEQDI